MDTQLLVETLAAKVCTAVFRIAVGLALLCGVSAAYLAVTGTNALPAGVLAGVGLALLTGAISFKRWVIRMLRTGALCAPRERGRRGAGRWADYITPAHGVISSKPQDT